MKTVGMLEYRGKRYVIQDYQGQIYINAYPIEQYPKDLREAVKKFLEKR